MNVMAAEMQIEARHCPYEGDECHSTACADDYCIVLGGDPRPLRPNAQNNEMVMPRLECLGIRCVAVCVLPEPE